MLNLQIAFVPKWSLLVHVSVNTCNSKGARAVHMCTCMHAHLGWEQAREVAWASQSEVAAARAVAATATEAGRRAARGMYICIYSHSHVYK